MSKLIKLQFHCNYDEKMCVLTKNDSIIKYLRNYAYKCVNTLLYNKHVCYLYFAAFIDIFRDTYSLNLFKLIMQNPIKQQLCVQNSLFGDLYLMDKSNKYLFFHL